MYVPNVSFKVEITSVVGVRLSVKGGGEAINFDVKARLGERTQKPETAEEESTQEEGETQMSNMESREIT